MVSVIALLASAAADDDDEDEEDDDEDGVGAWAVSGLILPSASSMSSPVSSGLFAEDEVSIGGGTTTTGASVLGRLPLGLSGSSIVRLPCDISMAVLASTMRGAGDGAGTAAATAAAEAASRALASSSSKTFCRRIHSVLCLTDCPPSWHALHDGGFPYFSQYLRRRATDARPS
jgi:hypothetical protein